MKKGLKIALIVLGALTLVGGGYMLYMKSKRDKEQEAEDGRMSEGVNPEAQDAPKGTPKNISVNSNAGVGGKVSKTPPRPSALGRDRSGLGGFLLGRSPRPVKSGKGIYTVHRIERKPNALVVVTFHNRPAKGTIVKGEVVKMNNAPEVLRGLFSVKDVFIDANGKLGGIYLKPRAIGLSGMSKINKFYSEISSRPESYSNYATIEKVKPD